MVALASVEKMIRELSEMAKQSASHVWLDGSSGLVVGKYPDATNQFDFTTEQFAPLASHASRGDAPLADPKRVISLLSKAGRVRSISRIETPQAIYEVGSATQMLVEGLNIVERLRPGTIAKLSLGKGRTKRPTAASREELYDVAHPPEHSAQLENGYYVATNNKAHEAIGYLKRAIQIAELEKDVTLHR